jgi:hypothetical protein
MHGMKNMSSRGFCECDDLYRSVKDPSHTVTQPSTVFYSVRYYVLTQVLMKIMHCRLVKEYGCFRGK